MSEHPVFRPGGISYLRIPATDPDASADFYEAVFGWEVRRGRPDPAFEDGSGHVIGHFRSDHAFAGEHGVRPYVFVENLDEALERIQARGCEIVQEPYLEGDLWVTLFRARRGTSSASGSSARAEKRTEPRASGSRFPNDARLCRQAPSHAR